MTLELNELLFFSAVMLHAFDVDQVYHSHLPIQLPEADFEVRYLARIVSVHFDSLEFSLDFVHHTMLVIQKGFTRLVKRYVEEQHPIIFQKYKRLVTPYVPPTSKNQKATGTRLSDT